MPNITIRKAQAKDVQAIHAMIKALALYEKAPDEVEVTVKELEKDGFGPSPAYRCIVAEKDDEVVGFALYFIRYSTWKGRCVYLEDFLVNEGFRGLGIGGLLFDEMISIAKQLKVRLMTWQVLDWNEPAIGFYKKYNAEFDGEWLNGKIYFNRN